jgi:hypothetical protein
MRARVASVHNRRVADAGGGRAPLVERATDQDIDKARRRYRVFKQHYGAMNRLKAILPFSIIDAMVSLLVWVRFGGLLRGPRLLDDDDDDDDDDNATRTIHPYA